MVMYKNHRGEGNMRKLLIADKSDEFRMALAELLQRDYHVKLCRDGRETLRMLQSFQPEVLVLDLMMPGMDGITLLQELAKTQLRPVILATTPFANDFVLERVGQLGVGYVMLKPCDAAAVSNRLADLTGKAELFVVTLPDSRTEATNMLRDLNVPTKLKGFSCLREALLLMMEDPDQSVTKELYPAVAEIFGGNGYQVERAIRSAIWAAWERRDDAQWQRYFPPGPDGTVPRPTNAAFISCLADRMLMRRKCAG